MTYTDLYNKFMQAKTGADRKKVLAEMDDEFGIVCPICKDRKKIGCKCPTEQGELF